MVPPAPAHPCPAAGGGGLRRITGSGCPTPHRLGGRIAVAASKPGGVRREGDGRWAIADGKRRLPTRCCLAHGGRSARHGGQRDGEPDEPGPPCPCARRGRRARAARGRRSRRRYRSVGVGSRVRAPGPRPVLPALPRARGGDRVVVDLRRECRFVADKAQRPQQTRTLGVGVEVLRLTQKQLAAPPAADGTVTVTVRRGEAVVATTTQAVSASRWLSTARVRLDPLPSAGLYTIEVAYSGDANVAGSSTTTTVRVRWECLTDRRPSSRGIAARGGRHPMRGMPEPSALHKAGTAYGVMYAEPTTVISTSVGGRIC